VISDRNLGANIAAGVNPNEIAISGEDYLEDHGIETTIPSSGGASVTFNFFYTNAAGKWVFYSTAVPFPSVYNNAGVIEPLPANRWGVFTLYASKDDIETTTPTYIAVKDDANYASLNAANAAINAGSVSIANNELFYLELARLGYVVFSEASGQIAQIRVDKSTIRGSTVITGVLTASGVSTTTTNFDGWLSPSDTTVQAALETLDDQGKNVTPQHAVLVAGAGYNISAIGLGTTGQLLVGATGADPAFGSIAYGDFTFSNLSPATSRSLSITNVDVNAASTSDLRISVAPAGGDAMVSWEVQGTLFYAAGVDNSAAGDPWKLTNSADPSSGDALIAVTNAGVITLFNDLDVSEGGTGVSTLTSHGILMGNGAGDINATAEPTDGQLLIGKTGDFPQLATITAGAGISVTNAAGSITITNTGAGATWNFVDANIANMVADNGYVCIAAGGALTLGLPTTAARGTELEISLDGATSWTITQAANQQIRFGNQETTAGAGGSLASTAQGDTVRLLCVTANLRWLVLSSIGNLTIT
jgi:hypothetical protein